jgi:hypothetical protein
MESERLKVKLKGNAFLNVTSCCLRSWSR